MRTAMSTEGSPKTSNTETIITTPETTPATPGAWNVVKGWFARSSEPKPDYGTGYYVKSDVHPVVPGPDMSREEIYNALNLLDETYAEVTPQQAQQG